MKTAIAYATKSGTTEKAAKELASMIEDAVTVNLKKETLNPQEYDTIIVGGSIRMGQLQKEAKAFLEKNKEELLQKKLGLFICCGLIEKTEDQLVQSFSEALREHALAVAGFGGELDITKLKGTDKFVAKIVNKQRDKNPDVMAVELSHTAIKTFSEVF